MADKFLEFARDPGDEEEDDDDEEDTSDDEGWDQREEEIEATEDEYQAGQVGGRFLATC